MSIARAGGPWLPHRDFRSKCRLCTDRPLDFRWSTQSAIIGKLTSRYF